MKKIKNILLLLPMLALFASCEEGEVFTGSPLDDPNQQIVTLDGVVSTPATIALTGQKDSFTVTLPMTFADTVRVEATTLSDGGRRRRAYVEILPNQSTGTGDIIAAGGDIYTTTFTLALTAIEFYNGVPGTHYLMKSNVINVNTGNTAVPENDLTRLQVRIHYPNASTTTNRLRLIVQRPNGIANATVNLASGYLIHNINNLNAATVVSSTGPGGPPINTTNGSTTLPGAGEFIYTVSALGLITSPTNLPYRIVVNYPNDTVEVLEGVLNGLSIGGAYVPILKINKNVAGDGTISFSAEAL